MKTKETYAFYPVEGKDRAKLCELLSEIVTTLYSRADGVEIEIERSTEYPALNPHCPSLSKPLITDIKIHTWDIAA